MSRLPTELYANIVRHTPLTSIDLVVRDGQSRMLLGLRRNRPAQGTWFVPGGRFGKNEHFAEALARITADELGRGYSLADARLLGVFEHFYADNFTGDPSFGTHYVVLAYALQVDPRELALPGDQHSRYVWLDETSARQRGDVHPNSMVYYGL